MKTDALRQYKELRTQVVDFITAADAALAENAATRGNTWGTELKEYRDKVANDRFEMVLIGAFQSGKSTFFNYLCDGRELSPVGFGIRTSGCKVSAHYVESDRDEKAVLTWRSPAELLQSLGPHLVPALAKKDRRGNTCLTENEINLSSAKDRKKLEKAAWEKLKVGADDDSRELLRLALLVSRFYPDFEKRCKQGTTETTFEEASQMASYPSNWSSLWLDAMQKQDLSCFKAQDVAFAFVGAIDVYVNSPMLQNLGCSVTDSPGLFISEWDTAIAQKCMRQADAVLFTFSGQKAMSAEEKRVLKQCIKAGVKDKMILGANLQIPEAQWQRILKEAVEPDLLEVGFEAPDVIPYHAALALRSREHMCLSYGAMAPETKKAIDSMIALKGGQEPASDEQRRKFLEKRIGRYVGTLSDDEEDWETYADMEDSALHAKLDERSGAPAFINAANGIMAPRKSRSVLIEQGVKPALATLDQITRESRGRQESLKLDIETKRKKLQELEAVLERYENNLTASNISLERQLELTKHAFADHYRARACQKFDERREEIVERMYDKLPSVFTGFFCNEVQVCQDCMNAIRPVFDKIQEELRDEVAREFTLLSAFALLRQTYEAERLRMMQDVKEVLGIPLSQDVDISLNDDYALAAMQMPLDSVEEIFKRLLGENTSFWTFIWNLLFLGLPNIFGGNKKAHARQMLVAKKWDFYHMLGDAVVSGLNSDGAPFQLLDIHVQEFSNVFAQFSQSTRKVKKEMEGDVERAEDGWELIEILGRQVENAEELRKRGASLRESCEKFCLEGN